MTIDAIAAAIITIGIEMLVLGLFYRRDALFLGLCAALNLATNLALNLGLMLLPLEIRVWSVNIFELLVLAVEYAVYACACGRSTKLFILTLAANVLSYCAGLLIFGHV